MLKILLPLVGIVAALSACGSGVIGDCPNCAFDEAAMRCAETSGCDPVDSWEPDPAPTNPTGPAIGSVLTYAISAGETLPQCFINGTQATKQEQVIAVLGNGCVTEVSGPDGVYVSRLYCATKTMSADWNAWTSAACTAGCHYFRWSFIGSKPVSCKAL